MDITHVLGAHHIAVGRVILRHAPKRFQELNESGTVKLLKTDNYLRGFYVRYMMENGVDGADAEKFVQARAREIFDKEAHDKKPPTECFPLVAAFIIGNLFCAILIAYL